MRRFPNRVTGDVSGQVPGAITVIDDSHSHGPTTITLPVDVVLTSLFGPSAYSPAITAGGGGFVLGNGSVDGWYIKIGTWVWGEGRVTLGNAGGVAVGAGAYSISLPFTTDGTFYGSSATGATRHPVGVWTTRDDSTGNVYSGILRLPSASSSTAAMNVSAGGTIGAANIGDGATAVAIEDEFFIQFGFWTT